MSKPTTPRLHVRRPGMATAAPALRAELHLLYRTAGLPGSPGAAQEVDGRIAFSNS